MIKNLTILLVLLLSGCMVQEDKSKKGLDYYSELKECPMKITSENENSIEIEVPEDLDCKKPMYMSQYNGWPTGINAAYYDNTHNLIGRSNDKSIPKIIKDDFFSNSVSITAEDFIRDIEDVKIERKNIRFISFYWQGNPVNNYGECEVHNGFEKIICKE